MTTSPFFKGAGGQSRGRLCFLPAVLESRNSLGTSRVAETFVEPKSCVPLSRCARFRDQADGKQPQSNRPRLDRSARVRISPVDQHRSGREVR